MNGIDLVSLLPIGWFALSGFRKGLVNEVFTLLALLLGVLVSLKGTQHVLNQLNNLPDNPYTPLVAHVLVFLIVILLVHFLGKAIERLMKVAQLSLANKLAGAGLGVFKALLLLGALFWLVQQANLMSKEQQEASLVFSFLAEYSPMFLDWVASVIPFFDGVMKDIEQFFRNIEQHNSLP